jgi:hypothetical protein
MTEQGMNEVNRLTGVLFNPKPAFTDIAARPRWWAPAIVLCLVSLTVAYTTGQRAGWERIVRQQAKSDQRVQQMPDEQREQLIRQQVRLAKVVLPALNLVQWPLILLITAGVCWLVFRFRLKLELTFQQAFAVTCYAYLPFALALILALAVVLIRDPTSLQSPPMPNLGALLSRKTTPAWLMGLATSVGVFPIWVLVLLTTGFSTAAQGLSWLKAFAWIAALWVVWLAAKTAWIVISMHI